MSPIDVPYRLQLSTVVHAPAVCHVAARTIAPGHTPPLHTHDFPEIFWIEAGRGAHVLGSGKEALVRGTLVFVAPEDVHGFETAGPEGYALFNLAFSRQHWRAFWKRYAPPGALDLCAVETPRAARTFRLEDGELAQLKAFSHELRQGQRTRAALDRFLLNLLHLVTSLAPREGTQHLPPVWLRRSVRALDEDEDALCQGTSALVRLSGRTPAHLSRECRRWFGKSPTELVNELRLERAAARLAAGDASVVSVAQAFGFSNMSHFYRLFSQRFSTTPAEHRAAARRVLQPT